MRGPKLSCFLCISMFSVVTQQVAGWPSGLRRQFKALVFGRGFESHFSHEYLFSPEPILPFDSSAIRPNRTQLIVPRNTVEQPVRCGTFRGHDRLKAPPQATVGNMCYRKPHSTQSVRAENRAYVQLFYEGPGFESQQLMKNIRSQE